MRNKITKDGNAREIIMNNTGKRENRRRIKKKKRRGREIRKNRRKL